MSNGYGAGAADSNHTYGGYLSLHKLLGLQRDSDGVSHDEMHFIITHQTFELWFKQVIREVREVRRVEGATEERVPPVGAVRHRNGRRRPAT